MSFEAGVSTRCRETRRETAFKNKERRARQTRSMRTILLDSVPAALLMRRGGPRRRDARIALKKLVENVGSSRYNLTEDF